MNTATPRMLSRNSIRCFAGDSARPRRGMITSCTKMLPHECRYELWLLMNAASIIAHSPPIRPTGSSRLSARGTVIWVCTLSLAIEEMACRTPSACSANEGWCRNVKAHTATMGMSNSWAKYRQVASTLAIRCSWGLRAEQLKPAVPCQAIQL